jgi:hypothetical protein
MTEGKRLLSLNATEIENMRSVADICVYQPPEKDKRSCEWLFPLLREKGIQPQMEAAHQCLVFDNDVFDKGGNLTADKQKRVDQFCGVSFAKGRAVKGVALDYYLTVVFLFSYVF